MIIREIDLFDGIGEEVEEKLVEIMESESYQSGDVVIKEGNPADNFYTIVVSMIPPRYIGTTYSILDP